MFKFDPSYKNTTIDQTDDDLKKEGNWLFGCKQYEKAINCYSKAIIKNPDVPNYFTNRALCYMKLKQWEKACTDCQRALEMDDSFVKACSLWGVALLELGNYDEAIKKLLKSHNLAKGKTGYDCDYVLNHLKKALRLKSEKQGKGEQNKETELLSYLTKLMDDEKVRIISSIKTPSDEKDEKEKYENCVLEIKNQNEQYTNELFTLFAKHVEKKKKGKIPDYLCNKALGCDNILKNPVVTPSGITYDRENIEEHLTKVGNFDPVSRQPLTVDQLIPNLALKEAIDEFLKDTE